jgi:hypothetical protein
MVSSDRLINDSSFYFLSEGQFEILSLFESLLVQEMGGHRTPTGWLSVSLSGPNGRVFGGKVDGVLISCTPTQVCTFSHANI